MADRIDDLLQTCRAALASGADFPTIWDEKLKRHPLVAGTPEQNWIGGEPVLEVRLTTGARLRFGTSFSIVPAGLHGNFW